LSADAEETEEELDTDAAASDAATSLEGELLDVGTDTGSGSSVPGAVDTMGGVAAEPGDC